MSGGSDGESGGAGSGGEMVASGGSESGSGGSGPLEPGDIVGDFDGYLYKGACEGGTASFECPLQGCQNGVLDKKVEFNVGGETGKTYELTVHVYGVAELRSDYAGGTRRQGQTSNNASMGDFFYTGGSYTPGMGYNVYGVRVEPAVDGAAETDGGNNYFLNARDGSGEGHEVYKLDYEMVIPVPADGKVTFQAYDPNCLQIMNNQETVRPMSSGTGPNGSIVISEVDDADPAPDGFMQPLSTGNNRTGQWLFFDVTAVEEK